MSEERRSYRNDRVLIESDRILSPQFADAVVFLSGAQIEMLRNVTQYLRRLDTYVSSYHQDYYLTPDASGYDDILAIVSDMEETLMGNPNTIWGYEAQWVELLAVQSTGEGATYATTTPVPAGYVYVLEHYTMIHTHGDTRAVSLVVEVGGSTPYLYNAPALPHNEIVIEFLHITLMEGDYLRMSVLALADTKYAVLRVMGYKMKIS